jgi:hypothetical protein
MVEPAFAEENLKSLGEEYEYVALSKGGMERAMHSLL